MTTSASVKPQTRAKHPIREYTVGEEVANSITHGIGIPLGVVALVLCIAKVVGDGAGAVPLAAAIIYGLSLVIEYAMSTLYHALTPAKAKRVFKVLDHSGIYLLIAGSYTPYCLITLWDAGGLYLALFVWGVSLVGIAMEAFWTYRPRWISAVLYVLLGWSVIAFAPTLYGALPAPGFWLLLAGGVSYTVGAVFYILKRIPYLHTVFHLFVLGGSVCQFLSILLYVL